MKTSWKRSVSYSLKKLITSVVFFFLWRALRSLYIMDSRIREEMDSWPQNFTLHMQAGLGGPHLTIGMTPSGPVRLFGWETAQVHIRFKTLDSAFKLVTGQLGVEQAYAEHRFSLSGDIAPTMSFVRCVDIAEAYLFPAFITHRILRAIPSKERSSLAVYRCVLFGF